MKHPLYAKFILIYVLITALVLFLISTYGHHMIYDVIEQQQKNELQDHVNALADLAGSSFSSDLSELLAHRETFQEVADISELELWIMDRHGTILLNTNPTHLVDAVTEFEATDSGNTIFFEGNFYGTFEEDMLSGYATLTSSFFTYGYVIAHTPVSVMEAQTGTILNILYLVSGVMLLLFLSSIFAFHFLAFRPLLAITKGAQEYAAGNFNYQIETNRHDEIGYLAKTLNFMASALKSNAEDQRKFIANISHDFRSPLTSIKGYIEAFLDGTIPPSMQEKYLGIVLNETERLNKLTQGLLELNTIDKSGALLTYSHFDIHHIIKKILATFEKRCVDKGITFELTFPSRAFYVYADMDKIQQVLYNLIDNAIKFSNANSTIFIETYMRHEKAFVSVKDQGVGIPTDSISKIWDRFYKFDASRGKDKKGTGLGLSITKDIISAHRENIDVISTEGVGTEFVFSLQPGKEKKNVPETTEDNLSEL